jgi:hypothetical protein
MKCIDSEMLVDHACGLTVCFKASTCRCNVAVLLPSIKTACKEAVCLLTLLQVAGCKFHAPTRVDTIITFFICLHLPSWRAGVDVWLTFWSARHTIQHIVHTTSKRKHRLRVVGSCHQLSDTSDASKQLAVIIPHCYQRLLLAVKQHVVLIIDSMSAALTGSLYVGHSMGGIGVCGCTTQPKSSDCFLCNGISALM